MLTVCPSAVVAAPCERVWALLADPNDIAAWSGLHVGRIEPPGPVHAGQVITGWDTAFERRWNVTLSVEDVDAAHKRLRIRAAFPFGLYERTTITCRPLGDDHCRVQYG